MIRTLKLCKKFVNLGWKPAYKFQRMNKYPEEMLSMIRKAKMSDLDAIMEIVENVKGIMQASGNFQWDDNYPVYKDFYGDISDNTLYLIEENGAIAGFICLNNDEPDTYKASSWKKPEPSLVIHRMAVSPLYRGRGFAGALLDFASRQAGTHSLRTDTFSGNLPMNALLLKHGFFKTGIIELPGKQQQPFFCYEK